ncbi:MAG: hypothetical protein Q9187_007898 [Circinaria calcarea]
MAPSTTPESKGETTLLDFGGSLGTVSFSLATESKTASGSESGTTPNRLRNMSHLKWEDIKIKHQELDTTQEILLAGLVPAVLEWRQGLTSCKELLRVRHLMDSAVWEPLYATEVQREKVHLEIKCDTQSYIRNAMANASTAALKAFPHKPEEA